MGLRGSLKDGVINPARWEPSNATSIRGNGNGTSRVLAIDGPHGSRRVVVATFGTVLQSDIVKPTPSYVGSAQQVQQVILAPFEHEWTRIYRFYGTVFDKYEFNISIFGPRIITIDEVRNQSFIMGWTSCQRPVTLIDVRGKKIQTQKGLDYKKIDAGLQNLLLWQHSFRVRVRI